MSGHTPISGLEIVLGLISFFATSYLGLAVYLKNPKSWTNRFFLLLAAAIDVYIIVNPISLHPPVGTDQLFWIRAVMFAVSFMPPFLFLLVHAFPGNEIRLAKKYLFGVIVVMLAAAALSLSPFVFGVLTYPNGEPVPAPGPGMPFFALNFIGFLVLSFVLLFQKHARATGQERAKTLYLLVGVLTTFTLMTIFTLVFVVILHDSSAIFLGPIFPVILMAAIGYAIVKHRFLDIQPVIARAVSFAIFLLILTVAYALIFIVILNRLLGIEINSVISAIFLGLTVAAMLSFQPVQNSIRKWSSKYFLRGEYDRDALLAALTHIMAENIELEKLTGDILMAVSKAMKIGKAAFLIIDEHRVSSVQGNGYGQAVRGYAVLEKLLHEEGKAPHFILDDLEEGALKNTFRELDVVFAAPIRVEKNEVAILILGSKLSGEAYYQTDVEVLDVFSAESGIAIQNAKQYEKIKQFNRELEGKVEERTKELKESQKRELAKAMMVAKLKDEFVFLAAHELRAPVTVIRGFLELVTDSRTRFSSGVKANLASISQASEHLNDLLNDLLEIARSEAGTTKLVVAPMDIAAAVKASAKELLAVARKKKITIDVAFGEGVNNVLADPAKLSEVLLNLIGNGVKYNREGGEVKVAIAAKDGMVEVAVTDSGYGIPKDQQPRIFEKFFRAQSRETQEITGTGLGLFITKMLVEKMNGKIRFSSEEGKGSVFAFSLPAA